MKDRYGEDVNEDESESTSESEDEDAEVCRLRHFVFNSGEAFSCLIDVAIVL